MNLNTRTLSTLDTRKLREAVDRAGRCWMADVPHLDVIRSALRRARTTPPARFPGDVITMNSRFAVMELKSGESISYTLVYPEDESLERGKLCVLSPMGMALLGARVGDIVHWNGDAGAGAAEALRLLYQPEAAGDHDL